MGSLLRMIAFAIVCLVCLGWLVAMIGNVDFFADRAGYEAVLDDVGGLLVDDQVEIAGVPVGKVESLRTERGRAVVEFSVDRDVELGEATEVRVRWKNAIGNRVLELATAGDGALEPGHRFGPEATREPADLDLLLARAQPLLQAIDADKANQVFAELARAVSGREARVQGLVADAARVLDVVAARDEAVTQALEDGATLADAYVQRREQVQRLLADAADLGEGLSQRTDVLLDAAGEVSGGLDELERLVADNDDGLRALLADLDTTTGILQDQRDDVKRVVETTGLGVVQYHRISRHGEWFNIRAPFLSVDQERPVLTERGASLPERGERGDTLDGPAGEPERGESGEPDAEAAGGGEGR